MMGGHAAQAYSAIDGNSPDVEGKSKSHNIQKHNELEVSKENVAHLDLTGSESISGSKNMKLKAM